MVIQLHQPVVCPVLIGRAAEMAALSACIEQAAAGQGSLVQVSGEAGVGKSRLVAELKRSASAQGVQLLSGQCFPGDRALPYAPLLDLMRAFLAPLSSGAVAEALGPFARALFPLLPEHVQHLPEIAALPPLSTLDPEQDKRRLFTTLADMVTMQTAGAPVLMVVEDIHWSDDTSLEFLLFLARQCAEQQLLLLVTTRTEDVNEQLRHWLALLDRERLRQEIALVPLTRGGTRAMLEAILQGTRSLPTGMLDSLFGLTEGNPFFLEEALKALITDEELVRAKDGWRWTRAGAWRVPLSLRDAIEDRLNRVSPGARRVLRIAAVAGRRFDFALLQQITQFDEESVLELVKELVDAQLVVEESADRFAFRHALTQQAISAGMLARERRALHRTIARTLEHLYGANPDAHLADLAHHFAEAELWEEAMEFARRAAEQAQVLYAPRAAAEQWTRAIQAALHLDQVVPPAYYRARAQAREILGDFEEARADYERVMQSATRIDDARMQWQSMLDLGFLWAGRDYQQAGVYFEQAVELAARLDDPRLQAHSLNRLGNWQLNVGQLDKAIEAHHKALELFEAQEDRAGMAETLDLLGTLTCHAGDLVNGVLLYERAVELLRALDNRVVLSSCLAMCSSFASPWNGHATYSPNWSFARCERDVFEALQLARDVQWAAGEAFAQIMYGGECASFGQFGAGLAHVQEGLRTATEINHQQWVAGAHATLASIYMYMLAPDRALSHIEIGLAAARELGSAFWISTITIAQVQAYCMLGKPGLAETSLREVRLQPGEDDLKLGQERVLVLSDAELALAQNRPELALQWCEQLLRTAPQLARKSEQLVIPRLWKCQGEALAAIGRDDEAIQVLTEARRGAVLQQYLPLRWEIERSLGLVLRKQKRHVEAQRTFAAARQGIAALAESIEDPALREHFEQAAISTLPKERPTSPRRAAAEQPGGLTERELEVATQIGQGKSNVEVAAQLVVSKRTVETYVSSVLSKLGLTSRSQIALWARDRGLNGREPEAVEE